MKKRTEEEFTAGFGKMVKGKSSLLLEKDELSDTQNMQPGFGWKQRRGMSELTSSAVATGLRFKSMVQFRTLDDTTNVILAHTYDSTNGERIMSGSALPPTAITWSEMYDLTASCEVSQWANVAKAILVANDKEFLIWRGTSHKPSGVFFYDSSTSKYINYYEEMTDGDTSSVLALDSMTFADELIVISEMPADAITPIVAAANSNETMFELYYWNGAWTKMEKDTLTNNASMVDENCDTYASPPVTWGDYDSTPGESTEETWNGREVFKFDLTAGGGARRRSDVGSFAGTVRYFTYRIHFYELQNGSLMQFFMYDGDTNNTPMVYIRGHNCTRHYNGGSETYLWSTFLDEDRLYNGWYDLTMKVDFSTNPVQTSFWIDGVNLWTDEDNDWQSTGTDGWVYLDMTDGSQDVEITRYETIKIGSSVVASGNGYVDGTRDATGVPLASSPAGSGSWEWNPPSDEIPTEIQGVPGFAYKLKPLWDLDSNVELSGITVHSPMDEVKDLWDGLGRICTGCYLYDGTTYADYTAYVNNMVEGQAVDLSGATSSYALYVGFAERCSGVDIYIPSEEPNATSSVVDAIYYYNTSGTATSVGTITDTTKVGSSSFAQKGRLSWADPGEDNEKMTTIAGDSVPMYWYKIEWSATLTDPCGIYYIAGIPLGQDPKPCYGCFAYKRRAWQLAPRNEENAVRYSASNLPNVWNGNDSGYVYFGERPLRAAAPFYNETVIYADTEMWMLQGNAPQNFGRLRLSANVGISAPQSLVSVESGVNVNDSIKVLLTWQFNDGFWLFDGVRIWKISAPDIDSFFDADHDDYINPTYLDRTYGSYDFTNQLVMWSVYSGSSATTPTKVLVLHVPTMWYGIFDYATDIGAILSVINNKMYMVAGGFNNGKFYLLDTGVTDVNTSGTATAVDAFVVTQDMKVGWSDGIKQRLFSVWAESDDEGGMIEVDEYPDGLETPVEVGKRSMTWLGKIFGAFQKNLKVYPGQKTSKFRIRNRSTKARMKLIGHSTTVDRGRSNE